jgi:CRP/FNR family transcriptional regulator, cyclic AMP receptor protein
VRKNIHFPSYLLEYNSISNPVLQVLGQKVIQRADKNQEVPDPTEVSLIIQKKTSMIDPVVLKKYGAKEIHLRKDEVLFREKEEALNYFQVVSGSIKMITDSPDGQEFIQGIFKTNDSFGEPPLFCSFPYPSSAICLEPSVISKLSKDHFFKLLNENFDIHLHLDQVLCERLKYKSMVLSEISSYDPEHRITSLLNYLKEEAGSETKSATKVLTKSKREYIVPFTRQQIADMSGLRVETVIRTVKKMEEEGKLKVIKRKITI